MKIVWKFLLALITMSPFIAKGDATTQTPCYVQECEPVACYYPCYFPWSIRANAIYWKPYVDGLEYCVTNTAVRVGPVGDARTIDTDYKLNKVNQETTWGFEVGFNAVINRDLWSVDLLWTHFRARGEDSKSRQEFPASSFPLLGEDVNDIWSLFSAFSAADFILGDLATNYDTVGLTINKDFTLLKRFIMRATAGLEGAIIREKLKISEDRPLSGYASAPLSSVITIQNDFKGIGPLVGIDPQFLIGCGFSLDAPLSISGLWGEYDLSQNQPLVIIGATTPTAFTEFRNQKERGLQPHLNLGLNLNWIYECECWSLEFLIGYELNYWVNFVRQNRITNPTTVADITVNRGKLVEQRHGDLILHGLNFGVAVHF